jgi:TRAP-type C4-dicarboxylate transport system substrate-binding protein
MRRIDSLPWRGLALLVAVVALAAALSACGSSSGSSSAGATATAAEGTPAASTAREAEAAEEHETAEAEEEEAAEEEGDESPEAELEGIIRIQIFGKFGGDEHEYDLVEGGTCKIVKINVNPAAVKADKGAILNHEKNASVEVAPLEKPATMRHCREAAESAIG